MRTRGFSVDYEEPTEKRNLESVVELTAAVITVKDYVLPGVIAGARRITKRFKSSRVEGLPDEESLSVKDRLELLDLLKSEGTITEEEYAQQRARILGDM